MIATQVEIEFVTKSKCRCLLLPVERGDVGELLPCDIEEGQCFSLQRKRFAKGVKVTALKVEIATLGTVTTAHIGVKGKPPGTPVWVITFARGNHVAFFAANREQYLKAKGVGLTHDPSRAAKGEQATVPDDEMVTLVQYSQVREAERREAARTQLLELTLEERLERVQQTAHNRRIDISREVRAIASRTDRASRVADR